jgi:glycosyltransferase involved in cell wall biosynthesis
MIKPNPQISFVIPLFNEGKVFNSLVERLNSVMAETTLDCEVVLINDGSSDNTAQLMENIAMTDSRYHCIFLSKNHGHQLALSAGLNFSLGSEAIFVLDGDLQDPPELLSTFYKKYQEGYDVVYAIRTKRKESYLMRLSYYLFYRFLDKISYIKIPLDSGDFSLMSRRVVNILNSMPEKSRYIRGMRTFVGFKQIGIEYQRSAREEGESKYSFKMLLLLAMEGIFNFSEFPIRFITKMGIISFILSGIYLTSVLFKRIFLDTVPVGFTALLVTIILFSSAILISIGILGEYLLRIFFQTKERPLYIIEKEIIKKKIINE